MPYVREAIASLENQTYRNFEVIVQDGASRDGTAEFLETLIRVGREADRAATGRTRLADTTRDAAATAVVLVVREDVEVPPGLGDDGVAA